jgi:hypothetical protein
MKDKKTRETARDNLITAVELIFKTAKLLEGTPNYKKLLDLASDVELVADTLEMRHTEEVK